MSVRVRDIDSVVSGRFPTQTAEGWDRVGLLVGDPDREVTGVYVTLDPTPDSLRRALSAGANVVLSHHPAALKMPNTIMPGPGSAGVLFAALDAGVALIAAHTNLDRAPEAGGLLPSALGLSPLRPIERGLMPMALVTVYVPSERADDVLAAMIGAGAGRIGDYERCSFSSEGIGSFTPNPSANPCTESVGTASSASESRIEVVAPPGSARGVVNAARAAHPYEEPLITTATVEISRGTARMGMLCSAPEEETLSSLVDRCRSSFGVRPRVWGDPQAPLKRVVTATGSAGSLLPDVRSCGAQALVAGEVRYHDALDAMGGGLCIIELGHDVSEWPLVPLLAAALEHVEGLDASRIIVDEPAAGWWTPDDPEVT